MKPIIELTECLRDSPRFRASIDESEENVDQLELKIDKLVKSCSIMVETGKSFINSKNSFISCIWDFVRYFGEDSVVVNALNRLTQTLTELTKYQSILIDQAQRTVVKNLNNFVKNEIRQVKETKKYFEKISIELDNALIRNSQAPKSKEHECEEANNHLTAVRSCFRHTALDYTCQLSCLQAKKRFEILDTLLSMMHAYSTFFHQGWDLFQDVDPFLKQVATVLTTLREETTLLEKEMEERHKLVTQKDAVPVLEKNEDSSKSSVKLEGYLFKRTSNAFKTWNRRWFIIQNSQLVYRKRLKDDVLTIMEEDLRLCTVKPAVDLDRRFCFEVLSPSKSHMLQADSDEACQKWIAAMQAGIGAALHHTMLDDGIDVQFQGSDIMGKSPVDKPVGNGTKQDHAPPPKPPRAIGQLLSIPGNEVCCDCGSADPRWASINLGITLCIECSGIHRGMGVHVSKVRSLTLDAWEPELLKVMAELGNKIVNRIYEADVAGSTVVPATPDCSRSVREAYIKMKYVQKAFVKALPGIGAKSANSSEEGQGLDKGDVINSPLPRRWSVRKVNRRRRTIHVMQKDKAVTIDIAKKQLRSLVSASDVSSAIPFVDSLSNQCLLASSSMTTATIEANKLQNSSPPLTINTHTVPSPKEDIPLIFLDLKSEGAHDCSVSEGYGDPTLSEKAEDNTVMDILVFGDSFQQETLHASNFELDSADESPSTEDDVDDLMPEDDIDKLHPSLLLYRAAAAHNLPVMSEALANGADPNWVNTEDHGRSPLHQAILSGSIMSCEYLMLNGAKCNNQDSEGMTSLHLATELGHTGQVCLLLKRGADQHVVDKEGRNALTVATTIRNANADIVTLLRLAKLNEEIRRDEFGNPGDETFNEVVRDFSRIASNNPERLRRQPSLVTED